MRVIKLSSLLIVISTLAVAQSGGDFAIDKSVIANGGNQVSGGAFLINSTIGQANASGDSTGGGFALTGGFWHNSIKAENIFENGFEN